LSGALAIASSTQNKTVIKLDDDGPYTPEATNFFVNANVTLDLRGMHGAVLHHKVDGPLIEVASNRTVTIWGGTIEGATGNAGDGILCNDGATLAVNGTTLRMMEKSAIDMASGCNLNVTGANISMTSLKGGQFVPEFWIMVIHSSYRDHH